MESAMIHGRSVPGWLFVAVPGLERDGNDFIPAAIRRRDGDHATSGRS